jgi:prefoldin alpha subunit
MTQDEELSRYMYQIEQYKEQLNQLDMQSQYLQAALMDYNKAKLTLENLKKTDRDLEILLPIGGGTFIDASAKKSSKVLVDIGSGLVSEKNYDDAIKKIDERVKNLEKTQEKLAQMIEQVQQEATNISTKAQQIMSDQNKK